MTHWKVNRKAKLRAQARELTNEMRAIVKNELRWENFLGFINFGPLLGYLTQAERDQLEDIIAKANPRKVSVTRTFQIHHAEQLLDKLVSLFLRQFFLFKEVGPSAIEGYDIPILLITNVIEAFVRRKIL